MSDGAIFWSSLILIIFAFTFHRMGPSFVRSKYGPPLSLLGISCLLLLTDGLGPPESNLKASIIEFLIWGIPFTFGSVMILGSAPIYSQRNNQRISIGWVLIAISWAAILSHTEKAELSHFTHGIWISIGLAIGLALFFVAISLSERLSGISNESEPLSQSERDLVETILIRRMGRN